MSAVQISGHVAPGLDAVREAFAENFARRNELGAACCIYVDGEKVVDLWGGIRNKRTGEPWEEDTMVIVYSASKGMSALAIALAHSHGLLDYEERVSTYWPEFARHGKERITVRQLLSHQAGLFAFDAPVDRSLIADIDRLAVVLADQKPEWEPGTRQAYHMISLGFYESELLRRVDPRHRSIGKFFQDEIATPLDLDFFIRLPATIPNSRLATIENFNWARAPLYVNRVRLSVILAGLNPKSPMRRAARNPAPTISLDSDHVYERDLEVPAGGGVGTARALARAYSEFATGGHELGVRPATLEALMAPAVPPARGFYDECLRGTWQLSLGFAKPSPGMLFGSPSAFGMPGAGGMFAYADPEARLGYAYVTNRVGFPASIDPREIAVRSSFLQALASREKVKQHAILGAS